MFEEAPSKSAVKREMHALQALGAQLAELPDKQFARIEFADADLKEALEFYRSLPSKKHEARRRQLQFIGKRMRNAEIEGLEAQLHRVQGLDQEEKRIHHQAEQWRTRLLEDPKSLAEFLSQFTGDAQRLNQLLRAAKKAADQGKDKGEARALYRAVFDTLSH